LDELIQYRIATLEYRKFLSKGVPEGLRFSAKNPPFSLKGIVRRAILARSFAGRFVARSFAGRFVARSFAEAIIFWNIVRRGDHFFGEHRSQRRSFFFGEHRSQRRSFILSTVSPRSHRKSKGRYSRRQQTRHKAKSPYFFYRGIAKFRNASNFSLLAFIIFVCSLIFFETLQMFRIFL
jgi:hypothetical protein